MPGRGRKPKPTARKVAAGNLGKRVLNKGEPDFGAVLNIDPPAYLHEYPEEMWTRVMPLLCSQKVIQMADLHNLEIFCAASGNWRRAQEDLACNGIVVAGAQGGPVKNPAATVVNECAKQMATFGSMIGLDPASRQRMLGGGNTKPDNPFGALLGG